MSSKKKMLEILKRTSELTPVSASTIGLMVGCQVNTVEKNICHFRKSGIDIRTEMFRCKSGRFARYWMVKK